MKKVLGISSVFIGLVIGAGFASGREIFEYFCIPSQSSLIGVATAAASFSAICYIIMHLSQKCNTPNFDKLITIISGRLAPLIRLFMSAFMFCGFFVMLSACGVLSSEVFNLPPTYGILALSVVCFLVFSSDTKGLVKINLLLVPVMLVGMFLVCVSSTLATLPVFSDFSQLKTNPLVASLCYVSYNTVTAGAVLVPLSKETSLKQIKQSSIIAGLVLGFLILLCWLCMNRFYNGLSDSEMPLLELASRNGDFPKHLYGIVLFMALCTTAVSHGFGILSKYNFKKTSARVSASAILCLCAIPFAYIRFSDLISKLYSAFGYFGFAWTFLILYRYIKNKQGI